MNIYMREGTLRLGGGLTRGSEWGLLLTANWLKNLIVIANWLENQLLTDKIVLTVN